MLKAYVVCKNWFARQDGQGMTEYALIIGLVAIALIAAVGWVTGGISNVFKKISDTLSAV